MDSRLSFRMHSTFTQGGQLTGLMERFTIHPSTNDRVTVHHILTVGIPYTTHTHTHTHTHSHTQERERERERMRMRKGGGERFLQHYGDIIRFKF